jgi:hypothetical protein
VFSIFKLRQDHRCQFEGAGHVGGKDVGNFHETCISISESVLCHTGRKSPGQ